MEQVTGLIPYLPPLADFAVVENWHHQLGLVGSFRIAPTNTNRLEVELDFRAKSISGARGPMEKRARFWANLTQAHSLIVSSLWGASGHLASDGRKIRGQLAPGEPVKNHPVLPATCTFSLGASPSHLAQIGTLFPSRAFKNSLLGAHPEAWVLVREEGTQRIIIPCFELLRTFYYVDGAKLMHFFFSHEPLTSVCQVLEHPTEDNGGKARVVFVCDGFTDLQYCTLAELALNPAFDLARQQTHGRLLGDALKRTAGTYPRINFQLGRDIRADATGFSFTAGHEEYFWVCAIRSHAPIWSFRHLEFETVLNHGRNSSDAGADSASPKNGSLGRPQAPALPALTGELAGYSQHSGVEGESVLETSSALPRMTQVPKEARPERYPGQRGYFKLIPGCFTYETGSDNIDDIRNDGSVGIGDIKSAKPASPPRPLSLPKFFEEIVAWFTSLQEFTVTVLTVNNSDEEHGERISVFPYFWSKAPDAFFLTPERLDPRPIAIACIQLGQRHFYFFQLLDGGRAALIFYKGFRMLEEVNINLLLAQLAADGSNWDRVRKTYKNTWNKKKEQKEEKQLTDDQERRRTQKEEGDQKFRNLIGLGLEITLRNHTLTTQGTPSAAALCEKELRRQALHTQQTDA